MMFNTRFIRKVVIPSFFVMMLFICFNGISDGVTSYGDTYINWQTNSTHTQIVIDGLIVNTTSDYYIQTNLNPGSFHAMTINNVTYTQTTGDYNGVLTMWGLIIIGYILLLLTLRIPLPGMIIGVCYSLFIVLFVIPNTIYQGEMFYPMLAGWVLIPLHLLAMSRSI